MTDIEVIPIGTKVIVGEDIPGTIQAILILPGPDGKPYARYDVDWWNGRDRKSEYFYRFQMKVPAFERATIGFGGGQ